MVFFYLCSEILQYMELKEGNFAIQGIDVLQIAKEFGTPVYVYDAETIENQFLKLKNAFGELKVRIKYATKALPNISILRLLKKLGAGADAVSIQEIHLNLKAGFAPNQLMFTPNCVNFSEIEEAVRLGVYINIDNLPFLEKFGKQYGNTVPCCIRINPHVAAGGNIKIQTGHKESKFGISIEQAAEIKKIVDTYHIRINGLHVHTGSDFSKPEVFLKVAEIMFQLALDYPGLDFLDFGSGFKVAYKSGDHSTDLNELAKGLTSAYKAFTAKYGSQPEIWFEPGKFLVSDSGVLLVNVNVVKETPAITFAGVDSGLNHLIRPMMYGAYHDIVNVSNPKGETKNYAVVGYICETDTFGWDLKLNQVREGDILAIKNAGAYGFSMSSNYNSRFRPAEILVYKGKANLIRERETFEDILRHQVELAF